MPAVTTVNDLLDGHVVLDLQCLDRIYLNGYVPNLHVGGQVSNFMRDHLGHDIPSPAIMERIGTAFRASVSAFAEDEHVPVVRFGKDDRKIDVMRKQVAAQAARGRSGVAAIGVAQEFQNVFAASKREAGNAVWFSFYKADRRVTCFYFYLWDEAFGRRSSRCAPISRIRSRSGSTGTNGPNGRPPWPGSSTRRCPTASPRPATPRRCRRSVTGSARATSRPSPTIGSSGYRWR